MTQNSIFKSIVGIFIILTVLPVSALTPVETHGKLTTSGAYILDKNGKIVQLRGMSFFWNTPDWKGDVFYTAATVDALIDSWKCTVLRVAYDRDKGHDYNWNLCDIVIRQAIKRGIYVIIDWHAYDAHNYKSAAITFFTQQAINYKDIPNVIFEIYNEPTMAGGATTGSKADAVLTWNAIKPYMTDVTQAIRGTGAENLVIIGTPYYSQYVDVAAADQPKDASGNVFKNVAYTFHFYAASHGSKAYYVVNDPTHAGGLESDRIENPKVPIFISEWGTTHSDGGYTSQTSYVDEANTDWWFNNYVNSKYHYSTCNWSVLNTTQVSSAFTNGGGPSSPSASGKIVQRLLSTPTTDTYDVPSNEMKGPSGDTVFNLQIPGTHAAASYNKYFGVTTFSLVPFSNRDNVDKRVATDNSCIPVKAGVTADYVCYYIKTTTASSYLKLRYLALNGTGTIEVYLDSNKTKIGTITIEKKTTWFTTVAPVAIPAGSHTLKFKFTNATSDGYSFEWFELSNDSTAVLLAPHKTNSANVKMNVIKNGFGVTLPSSHSYSSYSLIGADGRMIKSGSLNSSISELKFTDLSSGTWLLRLEGISGVKILKAVLSAGH
jgi:endoglucanase